MKAKRMSNKSLNKIKNTVLITLARISALAIVICGMLLDTEGDAWYTIMCVLTISIAYLSIFTYANL